MVLTRLAGGSSFFQAASMDSFLIGTVGLTTSQRPNSTTNHGMISLGAIRLEEKLGSTGTSVTELVTTIIPINLDITGVTSFGTKSGINWWSLVRIFLSCLSWAKATS